MPDQKIIWVERSSIDIEKWDRCVEGTDGVRIGGYTWYMDAVVDAWGGLVLGDYDSVMPVPFAKKGGQEIMFQPFFCQMLGVFGKNVSEQLVTDFLKNLPGQFKLVQFHLPSKGVDGDNEFSVSERKTQILKLDRSFDDIRKDYSSNAKRLIKKAEKENLSIQEGDLEKFITLFKETVGSRLKFNEDNYSKLKNLMQVGLSNTVGRLMSVEKDGDVVAYGYFFIERDRITYLKGAMTEQGKRMGASYFLMNEVITEFTNSKLYFDFGGSNVSSVAEFYKKLGGKDVVYYNLEKNDLSWALKKAKQLRDRFR